MRGKEEDKGRRTLSEMGEITIVKLLLLITLRDGETSIAVFLDEVLDDGSAIHRE